MLAGFLFRLVYVQDSGRDKVSRWCAVLNETRAFLTDWNGAPVRHVSTRRRCKARFTVTAFENRISNRVRYNKYGKRSRAAGIYG